MGRAQDARRKKPTNHGVGKRMSCFLTDARPLNSGHIHLLCVQLEHHIDRLLQGQIR